MAKSTRRKRKRTNGPGLASRTPSPRLRGSDSASSDAIKAAEEVAMAAFSSGLRLAAAFGTAAAKTASLALASLSTGADTFSELVKKEALRSKVSAKYPRRSGKLESVERKSVRPTYAGDVG